MDLIIPSSSLFSAGNVVPAQGGQRPLTGNAQSADEAPSAETSFADALSDRLGLEDGGTERSAASSEEDPSPCLTAATSALLPQGSPVPRDPRSQADLWRNATPEEGLRPTLGIGGSGILVEGSVMEGNSIESVLLLGKGLGTADSRPGHSTEQAAPGFNEPVSDARGTSNLLGTRDQNVAALPGRTEAEVSIPNGIGRQRPALTSDASVASAEGQDRNAPRVALPEEGGRAATSGPDADPGILLSRVEALKGTEPPGRCQLGDLPSIGSPAPAEADASWAGKDGATWKQDIPTDAPTRTLPSPASSAREVPSQTAQAASNGTFHVVRNTVHMQIQDEVLGPMRWHVHLKGEKITAEAVVETTRVQELLRSHQDVLESKLNSVGVQVEDFEVSVDQGSHRFSAFGEPKDPIRSARSVEDELCTPGVNPSGVQGDITQDQGLDLYA